MFESSFFIVIRLKDSKMLKNGVLMMKNEDVVDMSKVFWLSV